LFNFGDFKVIMDKIKKLFKRNYTYLLTFFIILLFPLSAYFLLVKKEFITKEAFFSNVLGFAGWIIALLIAWIHIRKNREDNLAIQNSEIRKRLEIETFKEVNKMIEKTNLALADIGAYYSYTFVKELRLNIIELASNKAIFSSDMLPSGILERIHTITSQQTTRLLELWTNFILSIGANEIVLTRFDNLKKVLDSKFKKSCLLASDFEKHILRLKTKNSLSKNDLPEFENRCEEIDKCLDDLSQDLTNYSIELMNEMLGEIFKSKIPKRKAKESRKTFTQILNSQSKQYN